MGLYKLCDHKGRNRDRCEHPWWGSFRGVRVSLSKWANREIHSKAEASAALDELRMAIRAGTFDPRGLKPIEAKPMTFGELAELYRDRHVIPKRLALVEDYAWSVKPFLERWRDRALADIRTADVQDLIADLQKPRDHRPPAGRARAQRRARQPHHRPAPAHAELGGRPRVHRADAVPAWLRDADQEAARGQQAPPSHRRGRRGRADRGGATARPGDDHRGNRHWHAPGRDAGAAVRRRRSRPRPDHAAR